MKDRVPAIDSQLLKSNVLLGECIDALSSVIKTADAPDVAKAVEVAIKLNDYLNREAVRKNLRSSIVQAASVLAGNLPEETELGDWADHLNETETYGERAAAFVASHKTLYS